MVTDFPHELASTYFQQSAKSLKKITQTVEYFVIYNHEWNLMFLKFMIPYTLGNKKKMQI